VLTCGTVVSVLYYLSHSLVLATTLVDTQQTLKSAMQIAIQLTREITSNHMRVGTEGVPEPPKKILHFSYMKRV